MGEVELIDAIRSSNHEIAVLYGQVISINFAMVVAIFYFLNSSRLTIKLLAFLIYLIGMMMFIGLMLEESNIKRIALNALAELPPEGLSAMSSGVLALHQSWLFVATAVFLNAGLWALIFSIGFLLFIWRKPDIAQHQIRQEN
ncbi:MAG: hypothetical protein R3C30_00225 [Hyphomonadaceae bacterium]